MCLSGATFLPVYSCFSKQSGWPGIRIMSPSGATFLPVYSCFS